MPASYGILYEEVFGTSPQVSVIVAPNLTVLVKDKISGKAIEGAKVTVDTEEKVTLASGLAVYGELPVGTYEITVSKGGYKGWKKKVTFEPGTIIEAGLWPWWVFGAGAVAATGVAIILIERWTRPKPKWM